MTDDQDQKKEEHRRNIERYRYLLGFVRDPEMRAILEKLLKEAESNVSATESKQRKNGT